MIAAVFFISVAVSLIWLMIGMAIGDKLKLPNPSNARQHLIICFLYGPIGMLIIYVYGFFNWLEKYYKGNG